MTTGNVSETTVADAWMKNISELLKNISAGFLREGYMTFFWSGSIQSAAL